MPKRKPRDPERSPDLPHEWIERHLARIASFITYAPIELTFWEYRRARLTAPGSYQFLDEAWRVIEVGEQWGGPDTTAFFRKTLVIPESHSGSDVYLDIDMDGGETQLSINGRPWQGLDYYRSLVPLGEFAQAGRELKLEMEAFIINYPYDARRHDERDYHLFRQATLVKIDRELEAFLLDARLVLEAYKSYWQSDENLEIEGFLRHHLETACREVGACLASREEARATAVRARQILRQNVFTSDFYRHAGKMNICAHSHLDIVYLWPLKETLRKNCRTITNMLSLMREYPDYLFSYSQPYLYEKLEEMYPETFAEVKQRVVEGRWEVIGAMYVEPDCNLLGPESFVRQLLFGQRYIRETFGITSETCWLPDVFGAVYTLPQILRKSGVKYFMTAKLNIWNDTNVFPHDTFRWRGPDGSEVLVHFPPTHFAQTYSFNNLQRQWQDFREKETVGENLFVYGLGDGGGGPTREMVEASLRTAVFPGLPHNQLTFAETFFHSIEKRAANLPIWDDELYLEAHRGTYTTKAGLKRQNRQVETLFRNAEILSSLAWLYGAPRQQERLNEGWKLAMLNQFHDILPGTHVPEAVADIQQDYDAAFAIGHEVQGAAVAHLVQQLKPEVAQANDLIIFNTLAWQRNELVETASTGATAVRINGGELVPVQDYNGRAYFRAPDLPSLGWTVAAFGEGTAVDHNQQTATFANNRIETPLYQIELDEAGNLERLYDKTNDHEVLAAPGNAFQVFEDNPGTKFSAWDIAYHLETYQHPVKQTAAWQLVANGPHFAVFTSSWQVLDSTIEQEMWLYHDNPRIDFHTRAEWRNSRKLLKVAFPLQIRSRVATYDLPFGHIERATHRNTDWEQAKFEVCGHKWADMSEGDYGVALLNDCKYGYDARENVLRLSLIRSPIRPDATSDLGHHQFTYSLLPHAGGWRQAQADRRAYELNIPALAIPLELQASEQNANLPATCSLLNIESRSLIVEALKQSEDGDELILRTFDSHGSHAKTKLVFNADLDNVAETNLLEESPEAVENIDPHTFIASYTPYEIKTHRLNFFRGGLRD
ncbi:alpha-mannosidase [Candidatus Leptofilum sp.]|uniref:alpha-mannosidase n=1 Tax=Candidatus Leptofilum sp. TaxID=3241576 RepID=UPI003B599699